jgi:UDP-glucose 4-epimerase
MDFKDKKVLVTGGAGFIGSNLVKNLLEQNYDVIVFDNFSADSNLDDTSHKNLKIIQGDLTNFEDINKIPHTVNSIFHLAADPEVRLFVTNPDSIFKNNITSTYNLLEWFKNSDAEKFVFTSSSTVYGDVKIFPTAETTPCNPISIYGASKLACESLISAYCNSFEKIGVSLRLANIVGPTSSHGIIFDMMKKLQNDHTSIEILGDGTQNKSYLYVDDCIDALIKIFEISKEKYSVYNLGSSSQVTVGSIVDIITEEAGYPDIKKYFTGGVDGGRGWIGDVKKMLLDCDKLYTTGWKPKLESKDAVRRTVHEFIQKIKE